MESFDNDELIGYLNERKRIQDYYSLFKVINDSVLFTDIIVENQTEPVVLSSEAEIYFNVADSYITVYTDRDSFKKDYFAVVDWFELINFTVYYQIKGIRIDTGTKAINLSRNQLLKHLDSIVDVISEYNLTGTFNYIFRVK